MIVANRIDEFKGRYRFLSNFYLCPIPFEGQLYPSAEHAYQASKTLDLDARTIIRLRDSPGGAKRYGRKVPLRPNWDPLASMEQILRLKFFGLPPLGLRLTETAPLELVEGNWWGDTFWGVCDGEGANHLGRLLMKLRDELQAAPQKWKEEAANKGGAVTP